MPSAGQSYRLNDKNQKIPTIPLESVKKRNDFTLNRIETSRTVINDDLRNRAYLQIDTNGFRLSLSWR